MDLSEFNLFENKYNTAIDLEIKTESYEQMSERVSSYVNAAIDKLRDKGYRTYTLYHYPCSVPEDFQSFYSLKIHKKYNPHVYRINIGINYSKEDVITVKKKIDGKSSDNFIPDDLKSLFFTDEEENDSMDNSLKEELQKDINEFNNKINHTLEEFNKKWENKLKEDSDTSNKLDFSLKSLNTKKIRIVDIILNRTKPLWAWSKLITKHFSLYENRNTPLHLTFGFKDRIRIHEYHAIYDNKNNNLNIYECDQNNNTWTPILPNYPLLDKINFIKIELWRLFNTYTYTISINYENNGIDFIRDSIVEKLLRLNNIEETRSLCIFASDCDDVRDLNARAILIEHYHYPYTDENSNFPKYRMDIIFMNYSSFEFYEKRVLTFNSMEELLHFIYFDLSNHLIL